MKEYTVKVTKQAYTNMLNIVRYIKQDLFSPEAANNLIEQLQKSINSLSQMPQRFSLVDEEPWRTEGIRKIVVKNFLIYFWIDEINEKVQVIGVIYGRRDQLTELSKLDIE